MVFNEAALDHFFQHQDELGLAEATREQLMEEGILTVMDLQFIDSDLIKELANNLHHPSG